MKIILSRKGFDSSAGGVPSPILPDGRLLSLPIPDKNSTIRYTDLARHADLVHDLTHGKVKPYYGAHLDPDLTAASIPRLPGWRPIFGQADSEQRVLAREGVGEGDLFLFFGWFRQVEQWGGRFRYVRGAPDLHVLWGWLEVAAVLKVCGDPIPEWAAYHPHVASADGRRLNTIYIAAEKLSAGCEEAAGAGTFSHYGDALRLTAPGRTRSVWSLPGWFHPSDGRAPLGFHGDLRRWSPDGDRVLLQTVGRGQEFVLDGDHYPEVITWAKALVMESSRLADAFAARGHDLPDVLGVALDESDRRLRPRR